MDDNLRLFLLLLLLSGIGGVVSLLGWLERPEVLGFGSAPDLVKNIILWRRIILILVLILRQLLLDRMLNDTVLIDHNALRVVVDVRWRTNRLVLVVDTIAHWQWNLCLFFILL